MFYNVYLEFYHDVTVKPSSIPLGAAARPLNTVTMVPIALWGHVLGFYIIPAPSTMFSQQHFKCYPSDASKDTQRRP